MVINPLNDSAVADPAVGGGGLNEKAGSVSAVLCITLVGILGFALFTKWREFLMLLFLGLSFTVNLLFTAFAPNCSSRKGWRIAGWGGGVDGVATAHTRSSWDCVQRGFV